MQTYIEYIPVLTTILSVIFFIDILKHFLIRRKTYLFWWTIGVATFGLGTLSESINALFGWNELNLRFWYVVGALLGGFPLAQGSVYLLMNRKFANVTSVIIVSMIITGTVCVFMTPVLLGPDFDGRLTGAVFEWKWVRYFSPLINLYSFVFLFGGAIYSAGKYYRSESRDALFAGNILIAIGALLPGIGGSFTRMGYVEVLFVTEFLGLALIYSGYRMIRNRKATLTLT